MDVAVEPTKLRQGIEDIGKSKSTTDVSSPLSLDTVAGPAGKRSKRKVKHHTGAAAKTSSDENWFYRAGAAISTQTLESKGQSFLAVSRSNSNTGLVDEQYSAVISNTPKEYEYRADDEFSPVSTRSRNASRFGSRAASARASRVQSRRASVAADENVLDPKELGLEPDFVDVVDDDDDEGSSEGDDNDAEQEVRGMMSQTNALGLGGLVDRWVGLSLFSSALDREDEDSDENGEGRRDGGDETPRQKGKSGEDSGSGATRRKRDGGERIVPSTLRTTTSAAAAAAAASAAEEGEELDEGGDGQGGWHDAAWLLSVASKVMF